VNALECLHIVGSGFMHIKWGRSESPSMGSAGDVKGPVQLMRHHCCANTAPSKAYKKHRKPVNIDQYQQKPCCTYQADGARSTLHATRRMKLCRRC
jgi:hypothetical protein